MLTQEVDVSDEDRVVRAMAEAVEEMGRVDGIIANVGLMRNERSFLDMTTSTAGTSVIRTRNASASTPNASARPIDLIAGWPPKMKLPNTKIMMIAAAVTTRAPAVNPDSTEPVGLCVCTRADTVPPTWRIRQPGTAPAGGRPPVRVEPLPQGRDAQLPRSLLTAAQCA